MKRKQRRRLVEEARREFHERVRAVALVAATLRSGNAFLKIPESTAIAKEHIAEAYKQLEGGLEA